MSYKKLVTFGASVVNSLPVYNNDPITVCLGSSINQGFNKGSNGSMYGQNSPECQAYLATKCASNWDDRCEYAYRAYDPISQRTSTLDQGMTKAYNLTTGDVLLLNTAMEKYRIGVYHGINGCQLKTEEFNPINPASPMISYYTGDCISEYAVNPSEIDSDEVMNKLLTKPEIALQLLVNIYNTMKRKGTLSSLIGTRLGRFYNLC